MIRRTRKAITRVGRRIWSRISTPALILAYHRVVTTDHDPQLLCVSPEHFREHLEILSSRFRPCSLSQLLAHWEERTIPPGLVALTFDDGYADNLHNAKRLLDTVDVPATVFVSTGSMDGGREFWWDVLERVFLRPGTLPDTLHIGNGELNLRIEMGNSCNYRDCDYELHRDWSVLEESEPTPRHRYYRRSHSLLMHLNHHQQRRVISQLMATSRNQDKARDSHRPLTASELVELAEGGLVEVGGHTVNHCFLSALPKEEQIAEIKLDKARLEEILNRPVIHFSYPYGTRDSFTKETVDAVQQAGYLSACANFPGSVRTASSRWQWPRRLVRDWDGASFERKLKDWFGA